jgi:hypothetical protein
MLRLEISIWTFTLHRSVDLLHEILRRMSDPVIMSEFQKSANLGVKEKRAFRTSFITC